MSNEVKRVSRELAYTGTVLKIYKDRMEFSNGNHEDWDFIHHDGAAAVIPVMDDGKILMVTQYRNALERDTLEIPAGKLDMGEDTAAAAHRELAEETGLRCGKLEFLGNFYPSVGFLDENLRMYLATELSQGETHPDDDEFVNTVKMPFDDAVKLIMNGEIKDGKTIAAILKVKVLKNL